jgi:hypothetical protein
MSASSIMEHLQAAQPRQGDRSQDWPRHAREAGADDEQSVYERQHCVHWDFSGRAGSGGSRGAGVTKCGFSSKNPSRCSSPSWRGATAIENHNSFIVLTPPLKFS